MFRSSSSQNINLKWYTQNKAINWPIKTIDNKSQNQEIMEFGVLGLSNNEIGILLYQSEAETINYDIKNII